jgi:hypothetical protein
MPHWEKWLNDEHGHRHHFKKKINKNIFCKKNRQSNGQYGKHQYTENGKRCLLCGHINKAIQNNFDYTEKDDNIEERE